MKKLFFLVEILSFFFLSSCNSQNIQTCILGNWNFSPNSDDMKDYNYVEIYIDDDNFNYYHEIFGAYLSIPYKIQGEEVYFDNELFGKIILECEGENNY